MALPTTLSQRKLKRGDKEGKGDIPPFVALSCCSDTLLRHHEFIPRTARASVGEVCYHVLNRGHAR